MWERYARAPFWFSPHPLPAPAQARLAIAALERGAPGVPAWVVRHTLAALALPTHTLRPRHTSPHAAVLVLSQGGIHSAPASTCLYLPLPASSCLTSQGACSSSGTGPTPPTGAATRAVASNKAGDPGELSNPMQPSRSRLMLSKSVTVVESRGPAYAVRTHTA